MRGTTIRKLLRICSVFVLLTILLSACTGTESAGIDNEKKNEVDGVIFTNDIMSITGVTTDEYLEVYRTQEITFRYFAKDFSELNVPSVLSLGGAVITVVPGEEYLDELPCSVLTVVEDEEETVITDQLEEFYICQDEQGAITIYYEIYNLYGQEEKGNTVNVYLNFKAYKIEFEYYVGDSKEQPKLEII